MAAKNGETYLAFLMQSGVGKTFSDVASGGGAVFLAATKKEANDTNAHSMVFHDNVGAPHVASDLPSIDVNFTTAPAANGRCIMVGMGFNSGTLPVSNTTDMVSSGSGTNPTASQAAAGIDNNDAMVYALELDNSGVSNGTPAGWTLLATGANGAGITYYIYARYPATAGDSISIPCTGVNVHWALTGYAFSDPGAGNGPYLLDEGVAAIQSVTHLVFGVVQHGASGLGKAASMLLQGVST